MTGPIAGSTAPSFPPIPTDRSKESRKSSAPGITLQGGLDGEDIHRSTSLGPATGTAPANGGARLVADVLIDALPQQTDGQKTNSAADRHHALDAGEHRIDTTAIDAPVGLSTQSTQSTHESTARLEGAGHPKPAPSSTTSVASAADESSLGKFDESELPSPAPANARAASLRSAGPATATVRVSRASSDSSMRETEPAPAGLAKPAASKRSSLTTVLRNVFTSGSTATAAHVALAMRSLAVYAEDPPNPLKLADPAAIKRGAKWARMYEMSGAVAFALTAAMLIPFPPTQIACAVVAGVLHLARGIVAARAAQLCKNVMNMVDTSQTKTAAGIAKLNSATRAQTVMAGTAASVATIVASTGAALLGPVGLAASGLAILATTLYAGVVSTRVIAANEAARQLVRAERG